MRNTFVITVMILASTCLPLGAVELGPVNVHGTVSQGYIDSSGNNFIEDSADGTLDFREYGINASLMLGERVTLGGQMFGREFGSVGNDDIYLDWLVAEYAWRDWLGCSVGKLKVPYGFYGKTRDIDSLRTGILLPQGVYMEYIRSSYNSAWSGSVDGYVPRAGFGGISYSLQCGVRDMDEDNGEMSRLLTGQNLDVNDIKEKAAAAAALTWHTPLEGLRVGGTWSWSEFSLIGSADSPFGPVSYKTDTKDQTMLVGSTEYVNGPLTLAVEGMYGSFESLFDFSSPATPDMDYRSDYWGWYLKGDYRCTDWLALGCGYSRFTIEQTIDVAGMPGSVTKEHDQDDWFISIRFDITENLILKAEEHFVFGTAGVFEHENPDGVDDDWSMTLVKLSYVF
jgi:hypothetical protein